MTRDEFGGVQSPGRVGRVTGVLVEPDSSWGGHGWHYLMSWWRHRIVSNNIWPEIVYAETYWRHYGQG